MERSGQSAAAPGHRCAFADAKRRGVHGSQYSDVGARKPFCLFVRARGTACLVAAEMARRPQRFGGPRGPESYRFIAMRNVSAPDFAPGKRYCYAIGFFALAFQLAW